MACFCVHSELPVFCSVFTCRRLSVCAVGAACPLSVGALWAGFVFCVHLTHSVPRNKPLIPRGCANAAHGMRPLFHVLCFCCLGKHSQTESSFKTNFLPMKRENPITSYCVVLTFKSAKMRWLINEILVVWSTGCILFMDDDREHKVVGLGRWLGKIDKLVRRRAKLCHKEMARLQC